MISMARLAAGLLHIQVGHLFRKAVRGGCFSLRGLDRPRVVHRRTGQRPCCFGVCLADSRRALPRGVRYSRRGGLDHLRDGAARWQRTAGALTAEAIDAGAGRAEDAPDGLLGLPSELQRLRTVLFGLRDDLVAVQERGQRRGSDREWELRRVAQVEVAQDLVCGQLLQDADLVLGALNAGHQLLVEGDRELGYALGGLTQWAQQREPELQTEACQGFLSLSLGQG